MRSGHSPGTSTPHATKPYLADWKSNGPARVVPENPKTGADCDDLTMKHIEAIAVQWGHCSVTSRYKPTRRHLTDLLPNMLKRIAGNRKRGYRDKCENYNLRWQMIQTMALHRDRKIGTGEPTVEVEEKCPWREVGPGRIAEERRVDALNPDTDDCRDTKERERRETPVSDRPVSIWGCSCGIRMVSEGMKGRWGRWSTRSTQTP